MSSLTSLTELARLATVEEDTGAAVSRALEIVRTELAAGAAYLVYGVEDDFRYFDEDVPLELSRTALWMVNRELTSRGAAAAFRVRYGRVSEFSGLDRNTGHDFIAAILPTGPSTAFMLFARGPWTKAQTVRQREFVQASAPMLGLLLARRLRVAAAESSQAQLGTLFSVGRVISEAEDLPTMLTRIATSISSLISVQTTTIDILDEDGSVRLRCMNNYEAEISPWMERWTRAAQRPDPVRNIVVATREPLIFEDAQNDERIPERGRAFFTSALVRSTAVFPLLLKDKVVGIISFGSALPTRFDGRQREIIEGVAAQIAAAVNGVQLYEDRRQAELALRRSEELLTATIESTADGILVVSGQGRVIYANSRFREMWRIPAALLAEGDDEKLIEFVLAQIADPEAWRSQTQALYASADEDLGEVLFKDGRVFERYSRPLIQQGERAGRVWSFRDVTERHRTEQLLIEQARHDSLTHLLNHASITDAMREAAAIQPSVGVVVLDVDGMKAVNDTYGHVVGDRVLTAVAEALRDDRALVGRYGGDEFVAVLPGIERADAEDYCRSVMERLGGAAVCDTATDSPVPLAVSMGLTMWPAEVRFIDDAIAVADGAMYSEKRERISTFDPTRGRGVLGDERAAKMIGELVPVLTSSARLPEKLRLVASRLAQGAGYAVVRFHLDQAGAPGAGVVHFVNGPAQVDSGTLSEGIDELVRATKRPIFIEDVATDERLPDHRRQVAAAHGLGPALCVPMVAQDEVLGFLSVAAPKGAALDARDARFLAAVAEQVTAIIRMDSLVADLEASATRLQDARADTVIMLAAAAEAHDNMTGRHLARVRTISELLGRELGQSDEEVEALGLAAILHDIGKIRVPESLLLSPARLDGSEWAVMKRHTDWGAEFLRQRPGFEMAADIAQHHHERWDGSGYPSGLAGEQIPAAAAIVTVADSLDAITNDRPYRAGKPLSWAIEEIVRCSGAQFSPAVVEALVRLSDKHLLDFLRADTERLQAA